MAANGGLWNDNGVKNQRDGIRLRQALQPCKVMVGRDALLGMQTVDSHHNYVKQPCSEQRLLSKPPG